MTAHELLGPVFEKNLPYITKALQGEKQDFVAELTTPSGKVVQCQITYYPDIADGEIIGFSSHVVDVTEIKNQALALKASELKFKGILESAPDAIVIADNNGIIQLINCRCEEMFGYTKEELVEQKVEMLMPEKFRKKHPEQRKIFAANPTTRPMGNGLELWALRKNGEEFPVDVSLSPIKTEDGILISAAFRDITWKVEKEKELLRSKNEIEIKAKQIENILQTITDSFAVIDTNWVVTYWNKAAEQVLGKSWKEVVGKHFWTTFEDAVNTMPYYEYQKAIETQVPAHFEFYYPAAAKWLDVSAYPSSEGLTLYFRDITMRKQQEQELIRTKNNQSALINATRDQIWSVDQDYRLVSANKAYYDLVRSYTSHDIFEGDSVIHPKDTGEINLGWKSCFDRSLKGESFMLESVSFSNHEVSFNPIYDTISNNIIGVACYSRDVSERKKIEREKAETEQRFTAMVQNGSDIIAILDEHYRYKYLSPSFYHNLGYKAENLLGRFSLDYIHPEDLAIVIDLLPVLAEQKKIDIPSVRFKHANGDWRWLESKVDNLLENQAVKGIVLTARDVTYRKEREAEREQIIRELTRSNSDLKQFSFITSHNLRAPLSNITGLLNLIDQSSLDDNNRFLIDMIDKSSKQLAGTINDITEIVVIKNNVHTPVIAVNIGEVFGQVNKTFINTENDIAAEIMVDFQVPEVYFNKTYLESIFINLISNAIKYRVHDCTLKIQVSTHLVDEDVVLTFSDNGIGIDLQRHKTRLFGMYQRFHSHEDGQGIGLFIVKSQIEALGGKIEVESEVDKGTTFLITFPRKPAN